MGLMVEKGASAQMGLVLGEIKRNKEAVHLLEQIKLPSRYESLISDVGADIAQLLVEPSSDTLDKLPHFIFEPLDADCSCRYLLILVPEKLLW